MKWKQIKSDDVAAVIRIGRIVLEVNCKLVTIRYVADMYVSELVEDLLDEDCMFFVENNEEEPPKRGTIQIVATSYCYNLSLLQHLIKHETQFMRLHKDFLKPRATGDIIKLINNEVSCIVQIENMEDVDCNGYQLTQLKVLKVVPGELAIKY